MPWPCCCHSAQPYIRCCGKRLDSVSEARFGSVVQAKGWSCVLAVLTVSGSVKDVQQLYTRRRADMAPICCASDAVCTHEPIRANGWRNVGVVGASWLGLGSGRGIREPGGLSTRSQCDWCSNLLVVQVVGPCWRKWIWQMLSAAWQKGCECVRMCCKGYAHVRLVLLCGCGQHWQMWATSVPTPAPVRCGPLLCSHTHCCWPSWPLER